MEPRIAPRKGRPRFSWTYDSQGELFPHQSITKRTPRTLKTAMQFLGANISAHCSRDADMLPAMQQTHNACYT
eukprot:540438-Amphidinium_carterae.1